MNRRQFFAITLPIAAASPLAAYFDRDHGNEDHGKHRGRDRDDEDDDEQGRGARRPQRYFRAGDYAVLKQYYVGPSNLPPGLRKKYRRTGTLPPGWEKRFQPLPIAVVRELPPPPPNCERGYVDGYAVVYDRTTRVIVDTMDIIGAVTGR